MWCIERSSTLMPASPRATMISLNTPGRSGTRDDEAVEVLGREAAGGEHALALIAGARRWCRRGAGGRRPASASRTSCRPSWNWASAASSSVAVVEEDVGPHAPVGAGDAREVAEARPGGEQRVARAGLQAGLAHEHVGQHVRQVAHHGHHAVVLLRVDRHRPRADLAEERVQQLIGVGVHVVAGRDEVRRSLVERGAGVGDAGGLGAAERVPADAAALLVRRQSAHERSLGAPHVGDDRARRRPPRSAARTCLTTVRTGVQTKIRSAPGAGLLEAARRPW